MQNYNAREAYARWRGSLGLHLQETRDLVASKWRPRFQDVQGLSDEVTRSAITKLAVYNFGQVVWGVFARAFWPIYMNGQSHFYGTVVLGFDRSFEDSSALFEIAEALRKLREEGGEPSHLEKFAQCIRDDRGGPGRVRIPEELTSRREAFFQSIYIPRTRLPCGYLHHRLVPVMAHRASSYACTLPLKYWPKEFTRKWLEGEPPLSSEQLAEYRAAFPNVRP